MKRVLALAAALLLVLALVRLLRAQAPSAPPPPPPTYTLTDLGPRMDLIAAPSGPTAISSEGQVAGLYFNYATQVNRGFFWSNGTLTELGTLGGSLSFGYGVNSAGQVVGSSTLSTNTQRAFIWQNGVMMNLGDPTGDSSLYSAAFAINTAGDVGGYENRTVVTPIIWKGGTHAGATALSSLPCQFNFCAAQVLALNDAGQAAGFGTGPYVTGPAGSYNATQAVMWDANGQATGLGSLGIYVNDHANAINSKGDVVGYSLVDPYTIHAVLWQDGTPQTPQDLGAIPGIDPFFGAGANITDNNSSAWGINSRGDIVGVSGYGTNVPLYGNGGRAFLYTNGQMYDLLSLLAPGTNWVRLEAAWAINDNGQIVGVGIDPNQQEHGFLLTPGPVVTNVTPSSGVMSGGNVVTVVGQNFQTGATVTFGSTPGTSVLLLSASSLTVMAPALNPGPVNVTVTNPDGQSATLVNGYTVVPSPIVTSVTPNSGTTFGGNVVIVVGQNFQTGATVTFGSIPGTSVLLLSASSLTVTAPALNRGPVNVTVTNPDGQSGTLPNGYTVALPAPVVTNVTPSSGVVSGGNVVTVVGQNFQTGATVTFGSTPGTSVLLLSASSLTVTAPALNPGPVNVTVTNPDGQSGTLANSYNVAPPPPPVTVIQINESVHVTDAESFPDVFDSEGVKVSDGVTVTPLINVGAPATQFSAGALGFSGQGGSQTLSVSDIGHVPLTLSSATISGSSQFGITQIVCSNGATSLSTLLPSGGACVLTISYEPSPMPASDNATLVISDDAALSNVSSVPVGPNYMQSIPLSGSSSSTAPPPPPPAVVPILVNESVNVIDTESFPDVFDPEQIHVTDQVSIQLSTTTSISITGGTTYGTPASVVVSVGPSTTVTGNVSLTVDGTPSTMLLTNGSATFNNLGVLKAGNHPLVANFAAQGNFLGSSAQGTLAVIPATPTINWATPAPITYGTALSGKQLNATSPVAGTLVYNPAAGAVLSAGSQTLAVSLAPNDTVDYTKAAASVTLVVNKAIPIINWTNPAPITLGTPLSITQLNATASVSGVSLSGTFAYNPPLKTVLAAGTQSLSVTFTPADTKNYQTVTQSVSITVNVSGNLSIAPGQNVTFNNGSISGSVTLNGGSLTLVGSTVGGSVTMSSGSLTLGGNSTVSNNVQIQGGSFSIGQASIKGNLQIMNVPGGKTPGVVCGASVSGDLQFQYNAISGQIGPSSCSGNKISGNLTISNNTAPLQIFGNSVGGNLRVQGNTGSAQIFQNTVQNLLQCFGNSSPFTGGKNTAASKQGQCANF